jgi:hypothetical protein
MYTYDRPPETSPYDTSLYTLIGEPVTTAEGAILRVLEDRDGDLNIRVQAAGDLGSLTMWYSRDYASEQGEGNFYRGAASIARSYMLQTDPEV